MPTRRLLPYTYITLQTQNSEEPPRPINLVHLYSRNFCLLVDTSNSRIARGEGILGQGIILDCQAILIRALDSLPTPVLLSLTDHTTIKNYYLYRSLLCPLIVIIHQANILFKAPLI
jgi:hypothetical protein